ARVPCSTLVRSSPLTDGIRQRRTALFSWSISLADIFALRSHSRSAPWGLQLPPKEPVFFIMGRSAGSLRVCVGVWVCVWVALAWRSAQMLMIGDLFFGMLTGYLRSPLSFSLCSLGAPASAGDTALLPESRPPSPSA